MAFGLSYETDPGVRAVKAAADSQRGAKAAGLDRRPERNLVGFDDETQVNAA
jgi:hypothetical protein